MQELTKPMVQALAALGDADAKKHGKAIAGIEELGWPAKDGERIVRELRTLAKIAIEEKRGMYMWVST